MTSRSDDLDTPVALAETIAPVSGLDETVASPVSSNPPRADRDKLPAAVANAPAATVPLATASELAASGALDHAELRTVAGREYVLGAELARGGMGRIRFARDLRLGRPVAVKELLSTDPEMADRFVREIRITARLQHPSIVSVYDAGRWVSGEPFFAMRVVPGKSLDVVIAPLTTLAERLALVPNVLAVVEALAYAHDQRIIHRDLKPGNVLVGPFGETVVIDWGLAKDLASQSDSLPPQRASLEPAPVSSLRGGSNPATASLTMVGSVMGTPAYMPPEQAVGDPVDERADVYALGAILYHVLAGRPPYVARRSDDLLVKLLSKKPAALAEISRDIPGDLVTIVEKAMAREPANRYASARELAADLRRFQTGQLVGAHAYTWGQLVRRWVIRHRAGVLAGVLALVATAVIGTIAIRNVVRARDRAEVANHKAEAEAAAANASRLDAERSSRELYLEQGRQELLVGNPLRAAALVRAALGPADAPIPPIEALLLGEALSSLEPLERRYVGIPEPIVSAGFSPDGKRLYSATWLGRFRMWDVTTGDVVRTIERATKIVDAGMTNDGKTLLLLGEESTLEVWDVATGTQRGTITIPGGVASRAAISPDNRAVAITGDTLSIWDLGTLTQVATGPALPDDDLMITVQWTPDGERVLIGGSSGELAVLDAKTWRVKVVFPGRGKEIRDCSLASDGKRYACVTPDGGMIYDVRAGTVLRELDGPDDLRANEYRTIDWSADGKLLAVSTIGNNARFLDPATGHLVRNFANTAVLAFTPNGSHVLAYGPSVGSVTVWDVATKRLVDRFAGHAHPISAVAMSPDGLSAATFSDDGTIATWRLAGDDAITRSPLRCAVRIARYSGTARTASMVAGCDDGTVDVYAAGKLVRTFGTPTTVPTDPILVPLAPDRVLAVLARTSEVDLWNTLTGERIARHAADAPIKAAGMSPDGKRTWADTHATLFVWDTATTKLLAQVPHLEPEADAPGLVGHHASSTIDETGTLTLYPVKDPRSASATGLAARPIGSATPQFVLPVDGDIWSTIAAPNGERVVVLTATGAVLFDLSTHEQLRSLVAQGELVLDARFVGARVYTQGSDAAIRAWNAKTGALEATIEGEPEGTQLFALSPDGALLATFAANHARLFDAATGHLLAQRNASLEVGGAPTVLAFSPAGELVATGIGATLWTWQLPRWSGPRAELDARLACEVPWTVDTGGLVPRALDACARK